VEGPIKERLTGALILVALLVIVVPEMLSGPGDAPVSRGTPAEAGPPLRTYSLQLDTASSGRSQDQSALTPKTVETPAPASPEPVVPQSEPEAKVPEATSQPGVDKPVTPSAEQKTVSAAATATASRPEPAASVAPASKPAPVTSNAKPAPDTSQARAEAKGQWWAQLGSFASRDNAERLTRDLRAAGYSVNLARVQAGGKELYRVRAGPEPSRAAALSLQARLAAAGHKSSLVAP
jgi:DedD protein